MKTLPVLLVALALLPASSTEADDSPFRVEVIFDRITVLKVVEAPFDTQEDLSGKIAIAGYRHPEDTVNGRWYTRADYRGEFATLWHAGTDELVVLGQNQSRSYGEIEAVRAGLTLRQVTNLEFDISAVLFDWEPVGHIRYKPCSTCGGSGVRTMRLSNYAAQIESMAPGTSKFLRIGGDNTFQLDFFEGDNNSSHVRAVLKIKVTRR